MAGKGDGVLNIPTSFIGEAVAHRPHVVANSFPLIATNHAYVFH